MKTRLLYPGFSILFLLVFTFTLNARLSAQLAYHMDAWGTEYNEYERLTNYVKSASAYLEVSVDSVIQTEHLNMEGYGLYYKVHDVLYGEFEKRSFRIFSSSQLLIAAIIQANNATNFPNVRHFCGNSYDGIRNMPAYKPPPGSFYLIGVKQKGTVVKLVLSGRGLKYDFGDAAQLIEGEVNYEAIKKVILPYSNNRKNNREQTLFSSRGELLDFLNRLR